MIKLMVAFDHKIRLWYFYVQEGEKVLHFRAGFRTAEEAEKIGDAWIMENLGSSPIS